MEKNLEQKNSECLRVVLIGPECAGKTTLAKKLAAHYSTSWVPEYMREYLQNKWDDSKEVCTYQDLMPIAIGQMKLENLLIDRANKILICDTNLLELKVYSELYYEGQVPDEIDRFALHNQYNLYLLMNVDIPWVADDLRDKPNERESVFSIFMDTLIKYDLPFVLIEGDYNKRWLTATRAIDQLIKQN